MKSRQITVLTTIIIIYMLFAFIWWAILLQRNNSTIFKLNKALIELRAGDEQETASIAHLESVHNRRKVMILGEGLVFGLTLAIGMYLISRAYGKEIEAARRQKNFLLSITHELKSPLSSINLILETLRKRSLPQETIADLVGDGLKESFRLEGLFDKILQATRLQSRHNYYFEEADITEIVQSIVDKYHLRDQKIEFEGDNTGKIISSVDIEAISIAIHNLIENAIKYSSEDGRIEICVKQEDQRITLSVADNGIGIPHNEKKHIFDQFYRVGSEDTRKTKGTGLGLYIVKGIVDAHDGKITIEDNTPKGSKFIITIPKK